ncbi:MAG: hypothetical protein ACREQQ_14030 [Candidatus Binatia bacterium]
MTARQGKIIVLATVVVLTVLLLRWALGPTGDWRGFAVTEVQLAVAMAVSWWVLGSETEP